MNEKTVVTKQKSRKQPGRRQPPYWPKKGAMPPRISDRSPASQKARFRCLLASQLDYVMRMAATDDTQNVLGGLKSLGDLIWAAQSPPDGGKGASVGGALPTVVSIPTEDLHTLRRVNEYQRREELRRRLRSGTGIAEVIPIDSARRVKRGSVAGGPTT